MAVTARTRRLTEQLRKDLLAQANAHDAAMIQAWARAWDEVAPDLEATLLQLIGEGQEVSRATLLRSNRLRKVLAHIADELERLTEANRVAVTGDLRGIITQAGQAQAAIVASQLPAAQRLVDTDAWSRVDKRQVDAIVRRSTQQITARHYRLSDQAYATVQRELVRGIAAGTNPRATARRIIKRTEGAFNGGHARALTIARTETIDAYRSAAKVAQDQHRDVLAGWVWEASMSSRTCRACMGMHGTEHPASEEGPLGHQNCRCARLPKVKSWRELGFDIDEPPSLIPDAGRYVESLSVADQEAMLGAAGRAAWARGDWPMEKWARRRSTDGWRDSYAPAPVPKNLRAAS